MMTQSTIIFENQKYKTTVTLWTEEHIHMNNLYAEGRYVDKTLYGLFSSIMP